MVVLYCGASPYSRSMASVVSNMCPCIVTDVDNQQQREEEHRNEVADKSVELSPDQWSAVWESEIIVTSVIRKVPSTSA